MKQLTLFVCLLVSAQSLAQNGSRIIDSLINASEYAAAITKSDELIARESNASNKASLICRKAEALLMQGKVNEGEALLNSVARTTWANPLQEATYLTVAGFLNISKGRQDLALEGLQKAYGLLQQSNNYTPEASRCLSYLVLTHLASGKYNQAESNALIALQVRQQLYGDNSEAVAASYNDLGLVYSQLDPDKALEFYEKALAIYQKIHGKEHPKIAVANTNIGSLYSQIELYGDAINNLEAASRIWMKIYPNGHPSLGFVWNALGQTYKKMGNNPTALIYFEKALTEYRKAYGRKNPDIASTLNQIGIVQLNQQQYGKALQSFQNAVCANIPSFSDTLVSRNPSIKEYYNAKVLLYSLRLKAQALEEQHFGKTLKFADLKLALSSLYSCDSLIDDIRHHSSDEADKISLGALASDVYEDGVRIATEMSEVTIKPSVYREIAFYFAEKSKSAVLQESIADTQAKSFAGIPQALVDEETNLKSSISFLSQQLSQNTDPAEEKYLRESLFGLNREYEAFTSKLEKDYPDYYNLKFNNSFPAIADLQKMLNDHQAIISYFIADRGSRIYLFTITNRSFKSSSAALPADFDRYIKAVNNGIYFREFETYTKAVKVLGKILKPEVPGKISDLIIIPSGRLGTVPMEAIPLKGVGKDFASTEYLANRFAISYEFSAGLIAQKKKSASNNSASIFLCAPVSFPAKDNLMELPGTEQEIKTISGLFADGSKQVITYKDANEARVKSDDISKYNFLHFATHGVVDETDPELSRIFLNDNSGEDGHLYAGEIYNLKLNADLAVLSACQTGLGKYSKGEGVIGLSRALVYAGARNLVVSFWSVADESTAQLMTTFYQELLKNPSLGYRHALQSAKTKMIAEKKFADPYFWAPFVLIGF